MAQKNPSPTLVPGGQPLPDPVTARPITAPKKGKKIGQKRKPTTGK